MSKFKTQEDYFAYSKTLSVIPAEDMALLFQQFKITIPIYVHRFVLRETIYPKVFQTKLYDTYSDELKYRLRGYNEYSVYLLEKLISEFNLDFDAAKYKEIFFNFLFLNRDLYKIKNNFFDELEKLKYKYTVDFEVIKYEDFKTLFESVFYEPSGYLDGVSLKILKEVLVHTCTLGDLRGLGEKYGVKVPRRVNKGKLIAILAARFRLSPEEAELLNEKSVLELEIYAKEKGFNISIDLKKSDMVEYIIFDLHLYHKEILKDTHNYSIPLASDLDAVKIDTILFEGTDQDIPVTEDTLVNEPEIEVPNALQEEEEFVPVQPVVEPIVEKVEPTPEKVEPEEEKPVSAFKEDVQEEEVQPEPVVKKQPKPEPVVMKKAEQKVVEEVKEPQPEPVEEKKPEVLHKELVDVTSEEKELLDEKINQIIKKYKKRRRNRRWLTIVIIVVSVAVLGFLGYSYLYYTSLNPGNLPFGIPVFW
ncbi:MAG: hypothetical protein KKE16_06570 [Firmicutes bacterium]|nr:hypothetical protein [Bacillota bacterium]